MYLLIAAIGHRPEAMGGIKQYREHHHDRMKALAIAYFQALECDLPIAVLSGLARGWETATAAAAIELSIPLIAAPPYLFRDAAWPKPDRARYRKLLEQATALDDLQLEGKPLARQQQFNQHVFHRADRVLMLWNGVMTPRCATAGMITLLKERSADRGIPVDNLWSSWEKYAG